MQEFSADVKLSPAMIVHVGGEDLKTTIARLAFFQALPSVCPRCGAPLRFTFRTVEDKETRKPYTYYGLECLTPWPNQHTTSFGVHTDANHPVGLFFRAAEPFQTMSEAKASAEARRPNAQQQHPQYQQQQAPPVQYAPQPQYQQPHPPPQQPPTAAFQGPQWQAPAAQPHAPVVDPTTNRPIIDDDIPFN